MIILFKLSAAILQAAGYKKLPNHVNSQRKVNENWISQSKWNKNEFPRFHLEKMGKEWYLHFDFFRDGEENHSVDTKSQIVRNERTRLKKLISKYLNNK